MAKKEATFHPSPHSTQHRPWVFLSQKRLGSRVREGTATRKIEGGRFKLSGGNTEKEGQLD